MKVYSVFVLWTIISIMISYSFARNNTETLVPWVFSGVLFLMWQLNKVGPKQRKGKRKIKRLL